MGRPQEIRVLENQMVYRMEKWGHEKQFEDPILMIISVMQLSILEIEIVTDSDG